MTSTRETILAQLESVLVNTGVFSAVLRNDTEINERQLPAAVLLDGPEDAVPGVANDRRNIRQRTIYEMLPQIIVTVAKPTGLNLGTVANELLETVVTAIAADDTVLASCVNGNARYLGMSDLELAAGNTLLGQFTIKLSFHYVK